VNSEILKKLAEKAYLKGFNTASTVQKAELVMMLQRKEMECPAVLYLNGYFCLSFPSHQMIGLSF